MLAAFIFVVDKKTDLISAPHALVYFAVVIFFVYFKLSSLLLGITDLLLLNLVQLRVASPSKKNCLLKREVDTI